MNIKIKTLFTAISLTTTLLVAPLAAQAADAKQAGKPKPYPLDTCAVSGEKLDAMGKPYVFTHEGQEIKLCCKNCLKDFKKEPAKYMKKIQEADKKPK
jgi:YHS domain-containing protein